MSKKLCAKDIGTKLGINWKKYDIKQFEKGLKVELEHGKKHPKTDVTHDDPMKTGKIVLAHLNEKSNYYDLLEKVESKRLKK
jgi:hypothetical protein